MGLSISVGILADLQENDPEMAEEVAKEFDLINALLAKHGLPRHVEPREMVTWSDPVKLCGFPYSWIHYLRRYAAHRQAFPDRVPPILPPRQEATTDPILAQIASPKSHLMWHSDCEGFYVPIDFAEVIESDRISGGMLGSSQRLLAELRPLGAPLGFTLDHDIVPKAQIQDTITAMEKESPLFIERTTWLMLFDAAKFSVAFKAAIVFG